jgi:Zinc finger, C2H2 type
MSEQTEQRGDPEIGICHICDREFPTQEELSKHLMDDHDGDTLADARDVTAG